MIFKIHLNTVMFIYNLNYNIYKFENNCKNTCKILFI